MSEQIMLKDRMEAKLTQWEFTQKSQITFLDSMVQIFSAIHKLTTQATGSVSDLKVENQSAVEALENNAKSKENFKYRSSGRLHYMQKKTSKTLKDIHLVGKRLRAQGMAQEKEFGKIVFQIQKPEAEVDLKGSPIDPATEKAMPGSQPIGDPFNKEHPDAPPVTPDAPIQGFDPSKDLFVDGNGGDAGDFDFGDDDFDFGNMDDFPPAGFPSLI